MPEKYVPKHRNAPPKRARATAKNAVYLSGIAAFATGMTVSAGVAAHGDAAKPSTAVSLSAGKPLSKVALGSRVEGTSRSGGNRPAQVNALKAAELGSATGVAVTRSENLSQTDPKALALALMPQYGLLASDFDCVNDIWTQESNWNVRADNPHSTAYGIPQALPGKKMATVGADWRTDAETQIRWGLNYIHQRYGTACAAWSFKKAHGYY
ncbi:MAG: hypothetical protein JWP74_3005 [Marmoricola sp.]|nr:hypothetical protein [Marmoricola sp.]